MNRKIIFSYRRKLCFFKLVRSAELEKGSKTDLRLIPSIVGGDMSKRHGVVLAKSIPGQSLRLSPASLSHAFGNAQDLSP